MRLFHVSEEAGIKDFVPRFPSRDDVDPDVALIWAIDEERLPNFLTPRYCPRITYHVGRQTTQADRQRFFSSTTCTHALIIEHRWFEAMKNVTLYLYEFALQDFALQDQCAGYYVSTKRQAPIGITIVDDVFEELFQRNVEVRVIENLWKLHDEVQNSTLNWSMCQMKFALPRR